MRTIFLGATIALAICAPVVSAQAPADGPYKILKTAKVGGDGGFDYTNVDVDNRRLYIARRSDPPKIFVYNLDTLEPVGTVDGVSAHGAVIDPKTHHGFATSAAEITMFDSQTLKVIKKIKVDGNPDGAFFDAFNQRVYILSHPSPHITVISSKDGSIVKTFDIGGMPEQMASDGKGHLYVDVEDKENVAVIDAKKLEVTAHYDVTGKGGTCAGLSMDAKHKILFAACRNPQNDGSVQHQRRGHADDPERKKPHGVCGGAESENDDRRQDRRARHEDRPYHHHRG
jgi:DNA-binding beta-propeller fold protein YncE